MICRAIGPHLAELWQQPVVVENHPGAGSTAGPAFVARSVPDGHTLLVHTSAQAYGAALRTDLPYDPRNDFVPIAPITHQPYVLVASGHANVGTVAQLVAAAKAAPGKLRFASTGFATGTHLGVEKLNVATGIRTVHLPPEAGESIADVVAKTVAGRADYQMAPIEIAVPHLRDGSLVALGATTIRKSALLPDVPTLDEAGAHAFDFPIWYGVWAPARTPTGVVAKLARDIAATLALPGVRSALARHGAEPMTMTQPEFARYVADEIDEAARIARSAGIAPR